MSGFYDRTERLIGTENVDLLRNSTVLVVGIGGVGGTALECLARSGIGRLIIVDKDNVDESNLNRQILFSKNDIGKPKVECAKEYIYRINNEVEVLTYHSIFDESFLGILDTLQFDFAIDAIDDIKSKILFIKYMQNKNKNYIVSLGMGNRLDPSKVVICKLDKTHDDPLAKKFRGELKKEGINIENVSCVFSLEPPVNKGPIISSMMMVPSAAGLNIASFAIKNLIANVK